MPNQLANFDPVGAFQRGRSNALAIRKQEQDLALQPAKNELAQLKLSGERARQQQQGTQFDQGQAVVRAKFMINASKALAQVPLAQRSAAAQSLFPQAQKLNIDVSQLDTSNLTDEVLAQSVSEAGTILQSLQAGTPVSALDQSRIDLNKARADAASNPSSFKREELDLKKQIELRQQTKLSAPVEKALLESQDAIVAANRNSAEFDILATQIEEASLAGGVQSSTSETLKALMGTQDDVTELRRRFNSVRLSEGLKNLPPGPATDKDMEQAFKGVPPENAPASQIASFLRGAAKMARFDAGYNMFKSDFISKKNNTRGLNKEWRKSVTSSVLGRTITIAEIYAEAAAEGMTPEDVKAELGIE
jgi:hypothetical protein